MNNEKILNKRKIDFFQKDNKIVLPNVYIEFLMNNNGISFNNEEVVLYKLEELCEVNNYMQIKLYAPNYIAIGDDGGDLVFLMEQSKEAVKVYIVDAADYNVEECYEKIYDFSQWVKNECPIKSEDNNRNLYSEYVDIELIKKPKNGIKDLAQMKLLFNLDISTKELLAKSKNVPSIIVSNISYGKAIKLIQKFNDSDIFYIKNHK